MMSGFRPPFPGPGSDRGPGGFNRFQKNNNSFYVFQPRPSGPREGFQGGRGGHLMGMRGPRMEGPIDPLDPNADYDGKRLRKAIARKTVDYNSSIVRMLESRLWREPTRERYFIQPDNAYYVDLIPPMGLTENPANCITTRFVRTSTNKVRCPIFCVLWTPEGRRLVTGASSGEFTLWNGLTFNFETILQAHDSAVRVMRWNRTDTWMVTGDHGGYVKYWQSNMNNVKMFQAHKDPVRGMSFCPTDNKFVTCSDDGTARIIDFVTCTEENILRGHGADVKGVDWHPTKGLVVTGSKDSQQPVKLWDPKTGRSLSTIHAHKNTVMDVKWNANGNWLLTASRDHLIKIFDIRNIGTELQTFRGHKKEAACLAWHPIHENLFASGGSDGSIMFWNVGTEKDVGCMEGAHESVVWSLDWHPLGHILASGSNDHSCKFWTRNRPGDKMRDKYNLNLLPKGHGEENEYDDSDAVTVIPGFDLESMKEDDSSNGYAYSRGQEESAEIPGLEDTPSKAPAIKSQQQAFNEDRQRKVPYSKPVPRHFEAQWSNAVIHHQIAPIEPPRVAGPPVPFSQEEDYHRENPYHPDNQEEEEYEGPMRGGGARGGFESRPNRGGFNQGPRGGHGSNFGPRMQGGPRMDTRFRAPHPPPQRFPGPEREWQEPMDRDDRF